MPGAAFTFRLVEHSDSESILIPPSNMTANLCHRQAAAGGGMITAWSAIALSHHATINTPKSPPPGMLCRERADARTTTFVRATAQDVKGKRSSLCDARRTRTCEVVHQAIDLALQSDERIGKTRHSPLAADRN